MIRACHGFIGILPFVWDRPDPPARSDLRAKSSYFRLELGLAARARKPMLVFADGRFGTALDPPDSAAFVEFDYAEVTGGGGSPNRARFAEEFARFLTRVQAALAYDITQVTPWRTNRVGLLLPPDTGYSPEVVEPLRAAIDATGGDPVVIPWPRSIDPRFTAAVDACDWIVTDIGSQSDLGGLPAFLEGWCVPLLRLRHVDAHGEGAASMPLETVLYGAYEVGYVTDIVRWSSSDELLTEVAGRLGRIQQEHRRIRTAAEARKYFRDAAPRAERVFISYRGVDAAVATPIVKAFGRRFQHVFDYKDGESIRGGRPWLTEIFDSLDLSALVVLLLSADYLASQNCVHEAQKAVESRDAGKLQVLPVKLSGAKASDLPNWLSQLQAVTYDNDADYRARPRAIAGRDPTNMRIPTHHGLRPVHLL